jgi:ADP-ribose pyrophosphatase YjhB (NUDIX family)
VHPWAGRKGRREISTINGILEKKYCPACRHPLVRKRWEGRERLFCTRCGAPFYENPIPAACVIVVDPGGRLLLVKRSIEPKRGFWCLPGGYMELGETPEETALRELREETGLTGRIDRIHGADSNPSRIYHTVALVCYIVRKFHGRLVPGDDAEEAGFFLPGHLPELAFSTHRKFIHRYLETP